ncbi:MAG: baseplate J/gp47 family protein [Patescibacteria group bacterium]|nr:baseplate J/gp47 family protein [Patescibacteria group bacterium]MCL5258025.1 baseplate J/gp47 family protein [Patescibacteria group bacterium]
MEKDYFYLKGTEELGDVIELIRDSESKELILVVPDKTKVFLHPINLDLLKKETERLKKKIYLSTEDEEIIKLVKEAGFDLFMEEYEAMAEGAKLVTDIKPPAKIKPKPFHYFNPVHHPAEHKAERHRSKGEDIFLDRGRTKKTKKLKKIFLVTAAAIALTGLGLFVVGGFSTSAKVDITPKEDTQKFDEIIILDRNATSENIDTHTLPGTFVDITKNDSVFQTTTGPSLGVNNRAQGVIVLTDSSADSLTLVPGTRFQSPAGKIYRSLSQVYVSGQGSVDVQVTADGSSGDYNLSTTTNFTIPGLAGTSWQKLITAQSKGTISGGGGGNVSHTVLIDDINNGRVKLENELNNLLVKDLALKYPDYVFPEEIGQINVQVTDVSNQVGQTAAKIMVSGTGELKAIGVKKELLISLLKDIFAKKNLANKNNVEITNISIDKVKLQQLDPDFKNEAIEATGTVTTKEILDSQKIVQELRGKSLTDIRDYLKSLDQVEKADIEIWPFWQKSFPLDASKIKVNIQN